VIGVGLFVVSLWLAWEVGGKIAGEDLRSVELGVLAFAGCLAAVTILRNWRSGFYLFMVWLLFEDLFRKYLGNGTALFFGKDVLALLTYISLYLAVRRGREKTFRPPFLLFLSLFVWLGAIQIFNQNSPSIFYGLLGFKLYFFYIPLIFVGYALIRNDEDLRKFLVANSALACIIAALGITQAILGHSFLNPATLAPELRGLGELDKVTPISGQILSLPSSVFVSAGRYFLYLTMAEIIVIGAAGYLLLYTQLSRRIIFVAIGLIGAGILLCGSRGAILYGAASAFVLAAGFFWGAPWRTRQAHRMLKAIRRSLIFATLGLAAILLFFPEEAKPRLAYYAETLLPSSPAYEVRNRTWDYPIQNFLESFDAPNWLWGNGIGTASLGTQYVAKMIGQRPPNLWVEEGYGELIIEMGFVAPFLWLLWTGALLYYSWGVVRRLKQTRYFPIAFAIFWYAFLLLYPLTYGGLPPYQNFVNNAFLWLLIGILFRLPQLHADAAPLGVLPSRPQMRGGLQF
jgi:hypothetical protein